MTGGGPIEQGALAVLSAQADRRERLESSTTVEQLATQGPFAPEQLNGPDGAEILELFCERLPSGMAILREATRVDAMVRVLERGGHAELRRRRESVHPHVDSPLQRMLDALVIGEGRPLGERTDDELLASLLVWRWATEAAARAGRTGQIRIHPGKDAIESELALRDVTRAIRRLSGSGCVGRDAELARLRDYCRRGEHRDLESDPAMVVYGIGGVGKSTLVARFAMDLFDNRESTAIRVAYLDLDRPTLASCDPAVVLLDVVRQVAAQSPDARRELLRIEKDARLYGKGAGLEAVDTAHSYAGSADEFISVMRRTGDTALVVVLDTYEQLEHRHPYRAMQLWDLFATLAAGLPGFRLIVSGRVPASVFIDHARPDRQLHVGELPDDAALALLRHLVNYEAAQANRSVTPIADQPGREVVDLVGGIPLTVRLAARVLVEEGPGAIADAATRARTLDRVRDEFVRGFLYQRILAHMSARPPVATEDLRRVARASIVLRSVTAELVDRVIVPSLSGPPPATNSIELFAALSSEVAFAEDHGGTLSLRTDLRGPALTALRLDDPDLVRRVHQHAVAFYAESAQNAEARTELAYHRLALGASPSDFDADTLRDLEPDADELPPSTAARVRDAVADNHAAVLIAGEENAERKLVPIADAALRDGRLDDARELLGLPIRTAGSALHRLDSRLALAEGDVTGAAVSARREMRAAELSADPTRFAAAAVWLASLHEYRGSPADADDALRTAGESELLAPHPVLRLELMLNRMNARERTATGDERSRWLLSLEARALMKSSDPRELAARTAVTRLLAAALGREEPDLIREALRRVGLGHAEDPVRVKALIAALAEWDGAQPVPGTLAKKASLRLDGGDPLAILRAWTALAGLGTNAGLVIDRVWGRCVPPVSVRERIREIYLWWAVDPSHTARRHDPVSAARPWLDDVPLDWSRSETRAFEKIMLTGYPTNTDSLRIAAQAGLDLSLISATASTQRMAREIISTASRTGKLRDLVAAMSSDPDTRSLHDQLRALAGDDPSAR